MTTKTIAKWFAWCFDQANQMHGVHTGGPYEKTNELKAKARRGK